MKKIFTPMFAAQGNLHNSYSGEKPIVIVARYKWKGILHISVSLSWGRSVLLFRCHQGFVLRHFFNMGYNGNAFLPTNMIWVFFMRQ